MRHIGRNFHSLRSINQSRSIDAWTCLRVQTAVFYAISIVFLVPAHFAVTLQFTTSSCLQNMAEQIRLNLLFYFRYWRFSALATEINCIFGRGRNRTKFVSGWSTHLCRISAQMYKKCGCFLKSGRTCTRACRGYDGMINLAEWLIMHVVIWFKVTLDCFETIATPITVQKGTCKRRKCFVCDNQTKRHTLTGWWWLDWLDLIQSLWPNENKTKIHNSVWILLCEEVSADIMINQFLVRITVI